MRRTPKVGDVLRCEYGEAVVVQPGTGLVEGLLTLLVESYGGPRFAADNPAIVQALPRVTRQTWRSTTKAYREGEVIDDAFLDDYWCPDGDGARQIVIVHYDGNIYDLGDMAADAEQALAGAAVGTPEGTSSDA